jgi:hypothetical protein
LYLKNTQRIHSQQLYDVVSAYVITPSGYKLITFALCYLYTYHNRSMRYQHGPLLPLEIIYVEQSEPDYGP